MNPVTIRSLRACAAALSCSLAAAAGAAEPLIPPDSGLAKPAEGQQVQLVTPLAATGGVNKAGWKMSQLQVSQAPDVEPRLGSSALRFSAIASSAGAKGDFTVAGSVPGEVQKLGLWVHVPPKANVARVGLQFGDDEGEAFLITRDVDWKGWQWVEFDLAGSNPRQAWKQKDKNGRIDAPLRHVNIAWFAAEAGPTQFDVNGLFALTVDPDSETGGAQSTFASPSEVEPGQPLRVPLVLTNTSSTPAEIHIEYELQRDSQLSEFRLPDPEHGTDHAAGVPSWTTLKGEEVERGSLTDLEKGTAYRSPWGGGHSEAYQYVDLGETRQITHIAYVSGDANWAWKVDIAASADGETWQNVPGMQGIDMHKQWGEQTLPVEQPFEARYLRLHYHNDGKDVQSIATPSQLRIYDGVDDEQWALPQVGPVVESGQETVTVQPRSLDVVTLGEGQSFDGGAYVLAARVRSADGTRVVAHRTFVMPEPVTAEQQARSPIGLNTNSAEYAESHQRLGIGWVRFENLKWRMVSRGPDDYKFDGLPPWKVDHDHYVRTLLNHNIKTLPYYFMSPEWASSAPKDAKHRAAYPPADYADYGEGVFQVVARYGNQKYESDQLKTEDKLSGLGLMPVYELWNEPNLNDPNWGHFIGTLPEYFEMFRVGAEAAKRADPTAKVANGGFAGITLGLVDQLRSYTYADGKRPIDFVDVLSVHTYTGAVAPERSVVDTNVDRSGNTSGDVSHEEHLRRLGAWRDEHRPDMPIWMTETGYDTAGPRGVSEREQAAYNVRNTLMMLANGVDKVFIYREVGSSNGLYAASGLLRNDGSFKPSWFAVATLIRQLDGAEEITRLPHDNPDVYIYGWKRGDAWTVAAWTIGDEPTSLNLPLGSARVTDSFGGSDSVKEASSIVLTELPIYLTDAARPGTLDDLHQRAEAEEQAWRQARQRLANLHAYLFDFGGDEQVGTSDIGRPRIFTPVGFDVTYTADKGHGFENGPAESNQEAGWIRNPTARDSVVVEPGQSFRVDVEPGRYTLKLQFQPRSPTGRIMIHPSGGEQQTLEVTRQQPEATTEITVGEGAVHFAFESHGGIAFISLVADE